MKGKPAVDKLQLSTPVAFLCVASSLLGLMAGQLDRTRTHPIALICGFVAWLIVMAIGCEWLEYRLRTALAARDTPATTGSMNEEAINWRIEKPTS